MRKLYFLIALSVFVGRVSAQSPIRYSVEKDIIHSYLTDFDYDTIDINVSLVMDYFDMPHVTDAGKPKTDPVNRLDVPNPVRLTWTHQDGAESQKVQVSTNADMTDYVTYTIDKDSAGYDLYNLIPGETAYFKVVSVKEGNETVVAQGQLEPTGMLRWIYAQGTWNVRDMGGWPGLGGKPIRYGQLFRGGQLTNPKGSYNVLLTESGIESMRNTGIRAELDLRSNSQAHYTYASFAKKDANNQYDADFTNIPTTSARMWKYDADNSNIKAFQWIIDELKAGKPVFYHCQNGADRTGTMGLLIGALLGMSDGDLAKDYELTTFCQEAAVAFDGTEVGFARLRNYEGKKGSVDNSSDPKDYMFAPVIDKLKGITTGTTTQRKIYNFFLNGVSGTKISYEDLDWFIRHMTGYVLAKEFTSINRPVTSKGKPKTLEMTVGQNHDLKVVVAPADHSGEVSYTSSNPGVAKVSDNGVITAVRGGTTTISIEIDGMIETVKVSVPTIESRLPVSAYYNGGRYFLKTANEVKNGSFEYGGGYTNWKNGKGTDMSSAGFDLRKYATGDSTYIESKLDGEINSEGSIRMKWGLAPGVAYVFGYKVKNSTSQKNESNENLKAMVLDFETEDVQGAKVLEAPTYDGNWTEIQRSFISDNLHDAVMIEFTHLSNDSNNTCLDNFYVAELDTVTGVRNIILPFNEGQSYDLQGRQVDENATGIIIKDGRKVLK